VSTALAMDVEALILAKYADSSLLDEMAYFS